MTLPLLYFQTCSLDILASLGLCKDAGEQNIIITNKNGGHNYKEIHRRVIKHCYFVLNDGSAKPALPAVKY